MKNTNYLILFLLTVTIWLRAADNDKTALNARSEWMGGFAKLEAADQASKANAPAALGMYKEALEVFESVRRKYPQWNPSLLNYRINYCQQKIEEIGRKLESQVNTLNSDELLELTRSQGKKLKELEAQKNELDVRVKFLSDALLRAREEAAKSSSLENTATALATARANLERKVSELEVRIRDYEKKNAQLLSDNSETVKLRKELDKTKQRAERAEESLREVNALVQDNNRETEKLRKTVELLTKYKNDIDGVLKAAKELADARGNELADAKRTIKVYEERVAAKERLVGTRDEELARIKKQLSLQQTENEELKRLRKSDSAVMDEFRKGKASAVAVESDNKKLKSELDRLTDRQNTLTADLKERDAELGKLRKELEKERANSVIKDEKNAELVGEVSKLRNKNYLAENENLKLSLELKETKILQDKANSDIKSANGRLKKAEEQAKAMAETQDRLNTQIELSKKQEKQLAAQSKEIAKINRDNREIQAKLDESLRLSAKLQERASMLEKRLDIFKGSSNDIQKKILVYEQELNALRERCSKLQDTLAQVNKDNASKDNALKDTSDNQSEANGETNEQGNSIAKIKKRIADQQEELDELKRDSDAAAEASTKNKELEKQLLFVMNELGVKNKSIEHIEKLAEEREAFYKQQLRERDEMLKASPNKTWIDKIKLLNEKLEAESKRRMALEATLVDLEAKLEDYTDAESSKAKNSTDEKTESGSTAAQEADFRISRERERKKMVANYLKQGSDSELQNKPEAAMFNYQKALELDSDNVIALQRLGIIAARQGNDRDTVKYLKQAFRFDTDNIDTLLALGFAQARLGEASWAVAYLGRAVALSPDNAYAAKIYGSALFNLGWTQAAESQLKNAYKLDPQSPEAPYNLAVLYATAEKPDFKEAAKWYKIAIANGAQRDPGLDATLK